MAVETARSRRAKQLLEEFLHWGIQEPDALYFYIQEYLGYRMPTKALCAHHQSPFEFIESAFFEKFRSAILMGARLSGKTLLLAILNHLDSMLKGKIEIIHTGASLAQANRGNRYFKETFEAPFMAPYLVSSSASPKSSYNSTSTTWNGSIVGITAGTMKGLNSAHGQRVKVDEVEVINSWEILQESMSISHSTDKIQAQDIYASTRKKPSGIMQRLLNEADERDMRVYAFCVWEVVERCERDCVDDKMYGTCPILNLCKGRAHHGDGWFKVGDLIAKAKNMSPNTFAAQWECKKPSDSQLVYGNYWYEDIHVLSLDPNSRFKSLHSVFGVWTIPHEWKRVGAIDFGARFCYLQFAIDPRTESWICEYEYFFEGDRLIETHATHIKSAPGWPRRMPIYADPSGKQERIELAKIHSIKTLPAIKNIPLGVDAFRKQLTISPILGRPKFFVLEHCARFRMEIETWSHPTNTDGTPNLDDYNDGPDEAMDCARYAVHSYDKTHVSRIYAMTIDGL
jgi:hypothetical protein